jgi:Ca-activated chloride channel family protein
VGDADLTPRERERRQAVEAQLRRVPDDPAGLLRQRFILQHLRREGRLP